MADQQLRREIRDFLVSRRGRITAEQAGLVQSSGHRRVPGLRRQEVADLASLSVEYYTQIERGDVLGVSEPVLQALMDALQLDDLERVHLLRLVGRANSSRRPRPVRPPLTIRPELQLMLDAMGDVSVIVRNARMDLLGGNALGKALFGPVFAMPGQNLARYVFLDPSARTFSPDYDRIADYAAGTLRVATAHEPDDLALTAIVHELVTTSDDFVTRWNTHDVRIYGAGTQSINHPIVGCMELHRESINLLSDPGLTLIAHSAKAGTPSARAFARLREPGRVATT